MTSLSVPAVLLFQDAGSMASDLHWIMICEVILTVIVVVLLLALIIGGLVAYSKIKALTRQVDVRSQPLLAKGQQIAGNVNDIIADLKPKIATISTELQPKIASISGDVQHISSLVRSKLDEAGVTITQVNETVREYNGTAQDVNQKARGQVDRVNGMVSEALTTTQHVSKQIQHGIRVPIEKIATWVTAAKIGVENLAEKFPFLHPNAPQGRPAAPPYTTSTSRQQEGAGVRPGPRVVAKPVVREDVEPGGSGRSGGGSPQGL